MSAVSSSSEMGFSYKVMTKDVILGSRNKSYENQIQLLPTKHEVPEVSGTTRAYSVIGGFASDGSIVNKGTGIASLRKF